MADAADPITDLEASEMRALLAPLFGPQTASWHITPKHYELLGILLAETGKCSEALHWVPRPHDFGNPLNWVRKQVRDSVRRALMTDKNKTYVTCSKAAAYQWAVKFREAGAGL